MAATIKHTNSGYMIETADGCKWEKYSLERALDFCRLLGFTPVIELGV